MKVATRISAVCLLLAFASAAGAAPTPQQLCNSLRIAAWGKYEACIAKLMA
jgi:hypothetical protein